MYQGQLGEHEQVIAPISVANNTTTTANIDMRGYDEATITVNFDAEAGTDAISMTLSLLESDDTVATNFTTVTTDLTIDRASANQAVYSVPMNQGRERYLRLSVTNPSSATATSQVAVIGASVFKSRAEVGPASTSDMVASTNDAFVIVT